MGGNIRERGGSYACRCPEIRWYRRNLVWDHDRDPHTGFRLARTLDQIPSSVARPRVDASISGVVSYQLMPPHPAHTPSN